MRRLLALATLLTVAPGIATAQGDTVTVEERVLLTPTLTPAEARRRAIEGALGEAVRRVAGVRVRANSLRTLDERAGAVRDSYTSVIQLDADARAVDYRVVDERWVTSRHPELGDQLYLRATVHVTVERERGTADPSFTADVALSAPRYTARGRSPHERDEIRATVRLSRAAHLSAFVVADDSVERLIPNEYVGALPAAAGVDVSIPPDDWRERGLRFRASLPPGRASLRALFVVVATLDEPPAPPSAATLIELQRWLVRIPADRRALAFAPYDVTR